MEQLDLTQEWDKVFPKSDKVEHGKATFHNRYGITLAADAYVPKDAEGKLPAIAVSGPFGAVKEQSSGLYAQKMAELSFFAIAFDPSYTGESGGVPRYVASPDINTEDFCAAVDFLSVQESVDPERIGIIGICGWGGMAINAAAVDTRIKATAAMTMYDMTRVNANGYFDAEDSEQARFEKRRALNAQRTEDYRIGSYALAGGVVDPLPQDAPQFVKDYYAYYKTPRGTIHAAWTQTYPHDVVDVVRPRGTDDWPHGTGGVLARFQPGLPLKDVPTLVEGSLPGPECDAELRCLLGELRLRHLPQLAVLPYELAGLHRSPSVHLAAQLDCMRA